MSGSAASDVVVCAIEALIERPILPVQVGDRQLLVIRDGERIVACERACPHEQADLALGRCAGGRLFCPRHYASFDLRDGAVSAGWNVRPLRLYPTTIRDGKVSVLLSPREAAMPPADSRSPRGSASD